MQLLGFKMGGVVLVMSPISALISNQTDRLNKDIESAGVDAEVFSLTKGGLDGMSSVCLFWA